MTPVDEIYDGECMDEYCEPDPVGIIIDPADLDPCESDDPPAYCEKPCETGDPVLDNEAIQIGFEKMWEDSNYGTKSNPNDESQRKEQVGFIVPNIDGGIHFNR